MMKTSGQQAMTVLYRTDTACCPKGFFEFSCCEKASSHITNIISWKKKTD
jgi:hypothetical protein